MKDLEYKSIPIELKEDNQGQVTAVIATFGVVDHDGDIIDPGAFTEGQKVPMAWAHDWTKLVGKGEIQVHQTAALFAGEFFMQTAAGREAYETVKAMDDLQEWSWGFRVVDAAFEQRDEQYVRIIKKAEVFEVSPVLKGAGVGTLTLDLKTQSLTSHVTAVLDAVGSIGERVRSVAGLRAKQGRTISHQRQEELKQLSAALLQASRDVEQLIEPSKANRQLYNQFLRIEARLNGVQGDSNGN